MSNFIDIDIIDIADASWISYPVKTKYYPG